jgi:hypothetical protein
MTLCLKKLTPIFLENIKRQDGAGAMKRPALFINNFNVKLWNLDM